MSTFLIAGLGNPGKRYEQTRHNAGFLTIDRLSGTTRRGDWRSEHQSLTHRVQLGAHILLLAKPQTFMNNSGVAVRNLSRFYQIPLERLLVVSDDLDLPLGRLRLRASGSAGGHNGLRSIIVELGSQEFPRLRMGIGRPDIGETLDWVLSRFSPSEEVELPAMLDAAARVISIWVAEGSLAAMNACNGYTDPRLVGTSGPSTTRQEEERA